MQTSNGFYCKVFLTKRSKEGLEKVQMDEYSVFDMRQLMCTHEKTQLYKQRRFDILNGFEFNFTRCLDCHKIIGLEARKFSKH